MSGHVYAVYSAEKGLVKIGHTNQLKARLDALRYEEKSSHPLDVLGTCEINQVSLVERALHWRFAEYREEGEWFRLHPNDLDGWLQEEKLKNLVEEFLDSSHPLHYGVPDQDIKELDLRRLGRRIRVRRTRLRMSQTELGNLIGLERTTIWAIENAKKGIGLAPAYRLVQALGFSGLDDLIGGGHD